MRRRGFDSHPVLSVLFDNSVAADLCPCCSGSLPPCHGGSAGSTPAGHLHSPERDAIEPDPGCGKAWLIRLLREQESAGSNPAIPTVSKPRSWISDRIENRIPEAISIQDRHDEIARQTGGAHLHVA